MRELGMAPVFQGFYGMVPNSLKEKFPEANIKEQGEWQTYQRPAFLDPNDPLSIKSPTYTTTNRKNCSVKPSISPETHSTKEVSRKVSM